MDYYTDLYLAVVHEQELPIEISIKECAKVFYCSERNAKLIIHKMEDLHWIRWTSGLGRGNKSRINFLQTLDALVEKQMSTFINAGQLDKALNYIQSHALPEGLSHQCYARMKQEFGYKIETENQLDLDILRIPMRRALATLDPAYAAITSETHIARQLFDCLVNYNVSTNKFVPHLAHSWEVTPDKKVWTFYLRRGILFHHGKELTAQDVRYSFGRICDAENQMPCRWYFRALQKMNVVHPYAITLTFSEPTPLLLYLSSLNLAILPSDIGFNPKRIIGTGAFRIIKYKSQQLVLERFADYFRERALLDRIELYYAPNLISGQKVYDVSNTQPGAEKKEQEFEENGSGYIVFNFRKKGPQRDPWLRKAISMLIDRKTMIQHLGGNRYQPSNSFLPSESRKNPPAIEKESQIIQLLKKSSYDGEKLKFYHFSHDAVLHDALWIKNRAQRVGISFELIPLPLEQFYDDSIVHDADMVLGGEVLEENIELGLIHLFRDQSSLVRRMMDSVQTKKIDQFIDEFIQKECLKERMSVFREVENYLRDENLLIYLYHSKREITFHAALAGIKLNAFGWADFSKLWIKPNLSTEKK
nr:ABC transporter substrate-binding protein [Sporolactobacillus kofuensis]